ncbi:hypothetical protein [Daejeonella sp.]|uniref:hypothetical protein n=1 Tax=Daejeonella sp. TaxID=2805397 RepID=UPI003983B597
MNFLRTTGIILFCLIPFLSHAQTTQLIGASEEFILENVKGYASVEERGIEHEEFNVLVFEDGGRVLSFYFTFYRGGKICSYIKNTAPLHALEEEIRFIKANFTNTRDNIWVNAGKMVQVQINTTESHGSIVAKELRN